MILAREALKKVDIFGQGFAFKYQGSLKYTTVLGGILSFLTLAVAVIISLTFVNIYRDTTKPNISSSTRIDKTPPKRNLYEAKFGFGVGLFVNPDSIKNVQEISRYLTPLGFVLEMNLEELGSSKVTFDSIEVIFFKACSDVEDKTLTNIFLEAEDEQVRQFIENFLLCPDIKKPLEYYVQSNAYSTPYRIIQFIMFPCSLPDPADCAPAQELSVSNMNFAFTQTSFTPSLQENPIQIVPTVKDFRIGVTQETRWEITLKATEIYDDFYDFYQMERSLYFIDKDEEMMYGILRPVAYTHCPLELITQFLCPPYSTLTIKSSGRTAKIVRKYKKALATLGEIGGASQSVFFGFGFFYILYNAYHMKQFKRKRVLNHDFDELKKIYEKEGEEESKQLDEISNELMQDREDIIRLYTNQTSYEVLQNAIFKEFHRKLIPVVLLNYKRKAKKAKTFGRAFRKMKTQYSSNSIYSLRIAYAKLVEYEPKNDLDKCIKDYFIKHLPDGLKTHAMVDYSPEHSKTGSNTVKDVENAQNDEKDLEDCGYDKGLEEIGINFEKQKIMKEELRERVGNKKKLFELNNKYSIKQKMHSSRGSSAKR